MSETRPILAVDVDGVLNACSSGGNPPRGWQDAKAIGYRIRYNPAHGARLLDLAQATGAELVWCTTWEALANEHIGPLVGLPELPVVPMEPGRAEASEGLKFSQSPSIGTSKAAAMRIWAGDRPFCWLDDEPDAASELKSHPVPHLVVRVDSRMGLQDHHFRRAAEWLSGLRCPTCRNTGQVWSPEPDGSGMYDQACPDCDTPYPLPSEAPHPMDPAFDPWEATSRHTATRLNHPDQPEPEEG